MDGDGCLSKSDTKNMQKSKEKTKKNTFLEAILMFFVPLKKKHPFTGAFDKTGGFKYFWNFHPDPWGR